MAATTKWRITFFNLLNMCIKCKGLTSRIQTILYRNTKCCEECKSSLDLRKTCQSEYNVPQNSQKTQKIQEQSTIIEEPKKGITKHPGTAALTNTTKTRATKVVEHVDECPYRRRCYQCRDLVIRIRSLLDEIKAIKKNTATGVICDYCNIVSTSEKCKRCEYLANRYKINENIDNDARQQRFKIWLCKVKQFLYTILEKKTCKYKAHPPTAATDELTHLLHELKSPLTVHEPEIGYFPSIDSLENITESKDILEQVLMRLKSDKKSEDFFMHSSCICKYFADKKFEDKVVTEEEKEIPTVKIVDTNEIVTLKKPKEIIVKEPKKVNKPKEEKKPPKEEKKPPEEEKKTKEEKKPPKEEKKPLKEEKKERKISKEEKKAISEVDLMEQMKRNRLHRETERPVKAPPHPPPTIPKIEDLPMPVRKVKKIIESRSVSESYVECDVDDGEVTEMVKGDKVVPLELREESNTGSVKPLLFKVQPVCPSLPGQQANSSSTTSAVTDKSKDKKTKEKNEAADVKSTKGVIRYMLSNREFIEKGWTLLPTTKIMRRMNIYKMVPVNPKYDWFERHKNQRLVYYDTGEKLAEIEENGSGKWFYKSGMLALDYCAKDSNSGHRYVVYSSGENLDAGRRLPVTVLASFDYLGNGVVYDHYGNERLKYNQSEGMVIDEKIGPQGKWKWHTLNDPPVLQPVFVDTLLRPTSCLEKVLHHHKKDDDRGDSKKKEPNLDMLAIELENFLKEKAHKLLQEFKPFQIKMKALKVNDQFSLKVLDQANIYLMFRDGQTSIKLNLGMLLISNEIVDTDTAEVTQVATPYDRRPPKSESIADIQNALERARKLGKARGKLRN